MDGGERMGKILEFKKRKNLSRPQIEKRGNDSDGGTVVDLSTARNSSPVLPKDYKNEEAAPWFVHNTEGPAIADKIQRRTDVYVRRIQHAIQRTDTYRKRKQDNPNYYEYGANGKIDLGWYNDLVAAAEDEKSAAAMGEVENLAGWTQEDFRKLVEAINNASPEIRQVLENREPKQNKNKPGYDEDQAEGS